MLTFRKYLFLFGEYFTMMLRCTSPIMHTRVMGQSDRSISFLSFTTVKCLWRETRVKRVTQLWYTIRQTGILFMNMLNFISLILSPYMSGFMVDLITSCVGSTITNRSNSSVRFELIHNTSFPLSLSFYNYSTLNFWVTSYLYFWIYSSLFSISSTLDIS